MFIRASILWLLGILIRVTREIRVNRVVRDIRTIWVIRVMGYEGY